LYGLKVAGLLTVYNAMSRNGQAMNSKYFLALPKEYGRSGGTIIFSASDHRPKRNAMEGGFAPYI
jgi:hypothetical protein